MESPLRAWTVSPPLHLLGWPVAKAPRHFSGAQDEAKDEAKKEGR